MLKRNWRSTRRLSWTVHCAVFFAEIRKENGEDFEPDSLKVMLAALERYLKDNNYQHSLLKDVAFQNSRKVLEGKQEIYARREREKDPKKPKV